MENASVIEVLAAGVAPVCLLRRCSFYNAFREAYLGSKALRTRVYLLCVKRVSLNLLKFGRDL